LFFASGSLIAAVGLLPQVPAESRKLYFSTFNTVILTVWWLYAYAFVVVPDEFVMYNADRYNDRFNALYLIENVLFGGGTGTRHLGCSGELEKAIPASVLRGVTLYGQLAVAEPGHRRRKVLYGKPLRHSLHGDAVLVRVDWRAWRRR